MNILHHNENKLATALKQSCHGEGGEEILNFDSFIWVFWAI